MIVSKKTFDALQRELDKPQKANTALKRLMRRKPIWAKPVKAKQRNDRGLRRARFQKPAW